MSHPPTLEAPVPFSRPVTPGQPQKVGWIGLGNVGYPMAKNLASRGEQLISHPMLVWNRTTARSETLKKELDEGRVQVAESIAQIAHDCDVIFTSLSNDAVIKDIYEQMAQTLAQTPPTRSKIFAETSTTYPNLAGELDTLLSSIPNVHLITCPVFGTPNVAEKSQLVVAMSGDYHAKKEVAHLLIPAVARKVHDLGGNLEKAPTFKLIGNSMVVGFMETLAEAHTLADKSGINAKIVHSLVEDLFPSPSIMNYSNRMINDKFNGEGGFVIDAGIKDAGHIRRLTAEANSPMPVIDIAHQHLITARALHTAQKAEGKHHFETLDVSGLVAGARVAAGLDGFDSAKHTNVQLED